MKVLVLSKALLSASYRRKLTELARLGLDVVAVVPDGWRDGPTRQMLETGRDDSYRLHVTRLRFDGHFHYHYYPELPHILRGEQPDLVHLDEEPYNLATFLGARACRRSGLPFVFFTWQNLDRRYPFPVRAIERRVYSAAAHALAGSEEAGLVLRRKGFERGITVVPQFGVDPEEYHPGPGRKSAFTVGFLNRLIPAKGPFVALDALARLPADVRLAVVGDGPLRHALQQQASSHGLNGRVAFSERVPSAAMPELIRGLDVVILPSLTTPRWKEQFGRVLIEAMACGVPVIGSNSGEIPAVIGDAGLIVPEGDAGALAGAIDALRMDAALRKELSERGRRRVLQHFTHAHVAEETMRAYLAALSSGKRIRR